MMRRFATRLIAALLAFTFGVAAVALLGGLPTSTHRRVVNEQVSPPPPPSPSEPLPPLPPTPLAPATRAPHEPRLIYPVLVHGETGRVIEMQPQKMATQPPEPPAAPPRLRRKR